MKRSAGSPAMITINNTAHQLGGGYPLSPRFLSHYCHSFSLHFIFALDLVVCHFLFDRNNTPFTSLHSLTSTKIGQAFKQAHPAKRRHTRASTRRFGPPEFLCWAEGRHHGQIEQGRGNTFIRKITGITVFICSKLHQIWIWKFENLLLLLTGAKMWQWFSNTVLIVSNFS